MPRLSRRSVTAALAVGALGLVGAAPVALARHGADDPAPHRAADDHGAHHHKAHRAGERHHGGHHGEHRRGGHDDGPRHT